MRNFLFIFLCAIWLADVAAMVAIAPLGKHVVWFSGLFCVGHILMILLMQKFPSDLKPRTSVVIIIIIGVFARLLFLAYPAGNDVYRYVWEGYIQNLGFNPFVFAPTHPALADIAQGEIYPIWQQINHPDFSAAYPPLTLLLFRLLAGLNPAPFLFKIVMIAFDIGVMMVLMLMINHRSIHPSRLILYAFNPLVLLYIAGEGHMDVIQLFFLCLSLYLILCKKHHFSGFLILGLAVVSKYFTFLAWPFLVSAENRLKSFAVLIPLILYLPFMDAGSGMFQSLGVFANDYHYNDSMAMLIRFLFGDLHLFATAIVLIAGLAWIYLFVHDKLRSVYLALGCLLLFLPTLHPWYLVLIAPFLVFFPSRAWLYLQAAVVFTFPVIAVEAKSGIFQEILWLKWFEYIPFYALLIWGLIRDGTICRNRSYTKPRTISAIVPVLNEEFSIGRCIESLKNCTAVTEIIVADGGSTDKTRSLALKHKVRVVQSPQGRGPQIKAGVDLATGDVILILHADCVVAEGAFERLIKSLEANAHVVGGAFGMQFKPQNPKTRFIALLNNVRTNLTGISFGDQAQFFRREALGQMGGFPPMMLMEDVELSLRLKEVGRLVFLRDGIVVSDRRWNGNRFAGNLLTVFYLFTRYLIERRWGTVDRSMRNYYEIYYTKPDKPE
jgi:rSAM/selenodomain-associated transferase 2